MNEYHLSHTTALNSYSFSEDPGFHTPQQKNTGLVKCPVYKGNSTQACLKKIRKFLLEFLCVFIVIVDPLDSRCGWQTSSVSITWEPRCRILDSIANLLNQNLHFNRILGLSYAHESWRNMAIDRCYPIKLPAERNFCIFTIQYGGHVATCGRWALEMWLI